MDIEVRILDLVGFLEVPIGFHLLEPNLHHESSRVFLPEREHVEVKFGLVREAVPEAGEAFVDIFRFCADIVSAVVVDVFGGEPVVENAVVVALV